MTPLEKIIHNYIKYNGAMSVADYMVMCLLHPEHGYYNSKKPIGQNGDFTTAPEISQIFGELIGLALAQAWLDQNSPSPIALVEIGPGNGTLMKDIMRATAHVSGFHDALDIYLVEASETLRNQQKTILENYNPKWITDISNLPDLPIFGIANEFFDCLPIRQYRKTNHGWQEQLITAQNNKLHFMLGSKNTIPTLDNHSLDNHCGDFIETSPASISIAQALAHHINKYSGAFLIIDYGDWHSNGDTLQALKSHKKINPLTQCGHADLTAHVCFSALHTIISHHATASAMTPQGLFLERLGITVRTEKLAQKLRGNALTQHMLAHKRLTHSNEMGALFKVLGITPKGRPTIAGCNK